MKKSSVIVKQAQNGDEANLHLCYCSNHCYFKSKCHNLHNVQLFFLHLFKELHKQAFRIYGGWCQIQLTVMTMAAIFKSLPLKMAAARKLKYLCNQLEVASNYIYKSHGIKTNFFLKRKLGDETEVVQCPLNVE